MLPDRRWLPSGRWNVDRAVMVGVRCHSRHIRTPLVVYSALLVSPAARTGRAGVHARDVANSTACLRHLGI